MSYPQQPPPNPSGNPPQNPYEQPPQDQPPPNPYAPQQPYGQQQGVGVPPYQQNPYAPQGQPPYGQPYGQPGYGGGPPAQTTNGLAIAALVMCVIFSPVALILGIVALNQINGSGGRQKGAWMAWVGIVWGAIGILVILFVLLAGGISTAP